MLLSSPRHDTLPHHVRTSMPRMIQEVGCCIILTASRRLELLVDDRRAIDLDAVESQLLLVFVQELSVSGGVGQEDEGHDREEDA